MSGCKLPTIRPDEVLLLCSRGFELVVTPHSSDGRSLCMCACLRGRGNPLARVESFNAVYTICGNRRLESDPANVCIVTNELGGKRMSAFRLSGCVVLVNPVYRIGMPLK